MFKLPAAMALTYRNQRNILESLQITHTENIIPVVKKDVLILLDAYPRCRDILLRLRSHWKYITQVSPSSLMPLGIIIVTCIRMDKIIWGFRYILFVNTWATVNQGSHCSLQVPRIWGKKQLSSVLALCFDVSVKIGKLSLLITFKSLWRDRKSVV